MRSCSNADRQTANGSGRSTRTCRAPDQQAGACPGPPGGRSDGIDGPTDAAGAWATPQTAAQARALGLDPADHLARNDAYPFFDALGQVLKTGPTHTNVMDVQIALVRS